LAAGEASSRVRKRVDNYTSAFVMAVSTFAFLSIVNFLPGAPLLPLLIGAGLGLATLSRPVWAGSVLALLVFLSILWQLIGFGLVGLTNSTVGEIAAVFLIIFIVFDLLSARSQPDSMALSILAVSLMLTPYYYLSIAAIVVAAAIGGLRSIGPVSTAFISTLTPLLLIENAIFYSKAVGQLHAPPIIFSQLSNLAANQVPPLGSLNIFLTGLGQGTPSPYSDVLIRFVTSEQATVILIPLIIIAIIFSSSASIAGAMGTVFEWLTSAGRFGEQFRVFSALIASVVTPLAFVLLTVALSPPNLGAYQTDLVSRPNDAALLIAGSVVLGGAFTGREFLVRRLEQAERMKVEITKLLAKVDESFKGLVAILDRVTSSAPNISVSEYQRTMQEVGSLVGDIKKGVAAADLTQLGRWLALLRESVIPGLGSIPESLRIKVVEETNALLALASTYNSILEEARAQGRLPERPPFRQQIELDDAITRYLTIAGDVTDSDVKVFQEYKQTTEAFNILMGSQLIVPPVDPAKILETHDYAMAMKLVAQDYWLNFHATRGDEFEAGVLALVEKLKKLSGRLDPAAAKRIVDTVSGLVKPEPSAAPLVLAKVREVVAVLQDAVRRVRDEVERLQGLSKSLSPETLRIVTFEILEKGAVVSKLEKKTDALKPSLEEVGSFADEAFFVFGEVEEARRKDARSMLLLSQYPTAAALIEGQLREKKAVKLSELPFLPDASTVYARLYASGRRTIRYDDLNEEVVQKHA
jgi:hypothetical protein